jgi:hypothetical protein
MSIVSAATKEVHHHRSRVGYRVCMSTRGPDWFRHAKADLRHARHALRDGDHVWACFPAQQAAEAVKAHTASSSALARPPSRTWLEPG